MAAMRLDSKNLRPGAHQQNILLADVPEQGLATKITQCYALREIWPTGPGFFFSHVSPSIVPTIDQPHSKSSRHTKAFLASQLVVAAATQHAAGDKVRASLVYTTSGHAMMRCLDDHANARRLEHVIDGVGDLRGRVRDPHPSIG
jgi:hypothetical protein